MKKRLFLIILILSAAISASTVFGACITPQDIGSSGNYTFCNGTYNLGESIDITANNVNLTCNGTVLYASTYASYSGIIIGNYENINIRGCNITNYYDAIYVDDGARDIIIDSNNMYYNNNSGIYIYEMHNGYINITSNNITNNYEGIYYDGYTPYTDEINIITNIVNDNSANGIGANANTETSTLRVISNEVIDNAGGVSWYVDDYAYVLDNYVKDNSGNGIGLFGVNGTESFEVKNNWVENNSDGIHLEGFSTGIYDNNTHKYNSRGLFLSNVHDLLIEDQLFEGNPAPPYGNGIRAEYCSNITISNADVGYNVEGLSFHTCEDITVEDSRIYGGATSLDSQACAIYFISYSNDTFFVIDNNSITDNENISGICMQTTSQDLDNNDINITNNNISNNYYGIAAGGGGQFYAYDFDEVNIINNVVENNPHAGVFTGDHRILRVINNDVINCGTGISDHYTDEYAYVLDNNVTDNNGTGIEVQGLDGNETFDIENNWVENSGTGIFLQDFSTGTYDNNPIKGNGNDTFIGLQLINVGVLVIDGEIIDRQTYYAVDIQSCSNITLRNFDIGYSGGGISFTDTNFTVEGSRIYSGYDPYRQNCGIYSMYYADPTYSFNALINNNNITDNENITGICIEASAGNHSGYINITNNNIINNHGGIAGSAGYHYYDEVNIINNVVKDNKDYLGGGTYGGQGIYFGIQRIARIINNDVINNGATGISVGVDEYAYILDNNVTDNGAGGIALGGIGGDELFEFNNNWVENNTGIGIDIIGFGAGVYENNTHKYNGNAGLWLSQVNNLLIEDQIFEGNGNLAININAEGSNIIIRNVTMRYNYGGIQLISGDDQNFTVEDSWIYGNTASLEDTYWTGIYIIDYNLTDGYITLVNNNISNNENSTGIYIEAWETQGAYVNITGNDIINNDGGIHYWAYEPGAEVDIIDNVVKDNPGGLGGITAANQRTATIINNEVVNNGIGISAGYSWGSIDEYVLVLDNYLKNNTGGIILSGVEGNETFDVENNWVENSGGGTSLTNFEDGLFTNNTMKEDTDYGNGLYLSGVDDSVFKDSYFLGFYSGAAVQDSYGNLIYNNYFNNTNDYGEAVYDFGANDWNTSVQPGPNIIGGPFLGGNYYTFYDEPYSPEFCYDVLFYDGNPGNDGFCDSNYSIPYGSNKDYHPLTWPTDQDYGDAPAPYPTLFGNDGARHILNSSLYLGASIDIETNGQPNPTATGDGEDEDGVSFDSPLHAGALVFITVNASASGYLDAWVDFDGDEEWDDPDERIFNKTSLSSGANSLNFTIPSGASLGYTYARFRFSSTGELSPAGFANDGEVEDYRIYIDEEPPAPVVPEFSTTTIILAILVIGLGITLIAVKKKQ